jgi:hypothetical protein
MGSIVAGEAYIKPYPQPALDGELGLTAKDIAKSLGVKAENVRKKIRKANYAKIPEFLVIPVGMINENNRLYDEYIFSVMGAKAFVARWPNHMGDAYFKYLLDCERIAEQQVPRMQALIEALTNKFLKPRKSKSYVIVQNIKEKRDIFGMPHFEIVTIRKERDDMTQEEIEQWSFAHAVKTQAGLSAKINDKLKNQKVIPFVPRKQIKDKNDE